MHGIDGKSEGYTQTQQSVDLLSRIPRDATDTQA